MLYNNLYTCINDLAAQNTYTCTLLVNANHDIFKGHFPAQPVVPGVCMMEIVKEMLAHNISRKIVLTSAPVVKFMMLIQPDTKPILTINWTEQNDEFKCDAVFKYGDSVLFKMSAVYNTNHNYRPIT
ncbi:MAG: hypothetical protein H7257_10455 [Taibaiella sp.]|nr:hypothetical protein [Taibaiella sp.]